MTLLGYTDGASRGNPGESGIGIVVKNEKGDTLFKTGGYIGKATNNLAEYSALLTLVKKVRTMECSRLVVHSDSELMVKQLNGEYKTKNQEIAKLSDRIRKLLATSSFAFEIRHIPREANLEADGLANEGIDSRKRLRV
jgi:ribonuclease HI